MFISLVTMIRLEFDLCAEKRMKFSMLDGSDDALLTEKCSCRLSSVSGSNENMMRPIETRTLLISSSWSLEDRVRLVEDLSLAFGFA